MFSFKKLIIKKYADISVEIYSEILILMIQT